MNAMNKLAPGKREKTWVCLLIVILDFLSYKAGMYAIVFLYICNLTFSFLFGGYQNFELCVKHKQIIWGFFCYYFILRQY